MGGDFHILFWKGWLFFVMVIYFHMYKRAAFAAQIGVPIIMHEGGCKGGILYS